MHLPAYKLYVSSSYIEEALKGRGVAVIDDEKNILEKAKRYRKELVPKGALVISNKSKFLLFSKTPVMNKESLFSRNI